MLTGTVTSNESSEPSHGSTRIAPWWLISSSDVTAQRMAFGFGLLAFFWWIAVFADGDSHPGRLIFIAAFMTLAATQATATALALWRHPELATAARRTLRPLTQVALFAAAIIGSLSGWLITHAIGWAIAAAFATVWALSLGSRALVRRRRR